MGRVILMTEDCFTNKHEQCRGYNGPADNPNFKCECECHRQTEEVKNG